MTSTLDDSHDGSIHNSLQNNNQNNENLWTILTIQITNK